MAKVSKAAPARAVSNDPILSILNEVEAALGQMLQRLELAISPEDVRKQATIFKDVPGRNRDQYVQVKAAQFLLDSVRQKEMKPDALFGDLGIHGNIATGQHGLGVATAQIMLRELSLYHGKLDASFGSGVRGATQKFQRDVMKLEHQSGVIDAATQAALSAAYMEHITQREALDAKKAELTKAGFSVKDIELGGATQLRPALTALGKTADEFVADYNAHAPSVVESARLYPSLDIKNPEQVLAAARLQLVQQIRDASAALKTEGLTTEIRAQHEKQLTRALSGLGVPVASAADALKKADAVTDPHFSYAPFDIARLPSAGGIDKARLTTNLDNIPKTLKGIASFYSGNGGQDGGSITASGMPFRRDLPIIAVPPGHAELYGTVADVTIGGITKQGLIADTGSFYLSKYDVGGQSRAFDLSRGLAKQFPDMLDDGLKKGELRINIAATIAWRKANGLPYQFAGDASGQPLSEVAQAANQLRPQIGAAGLAQFDEAAVTRRAILGRLVKAYDEAKGEIGEEDLRTLQKALAQEKSPAGERLYTKKIDGIDGPGTRGAVGAYKERVVSSEPIHATHAQAELEPKAPARVIARDNTAKPEVARA